MLEEKRWGARGNISLLKIKGWIGAPTQNSAVQNYGGAKNRRT